MQFGIYLLKRGLLTTDQLVEALDTQQTAQPQLGQLAIEAGLMSVRDVFRVLRVQSDFSAERFGETAVDMDMLKRRDVAELLLLQSDRRQKLCDIFVELGFLDREACDRELEAFRRECERTGAKRQIEVLRLPATKTTAGGLEKV
ncbi:MAG: hypothetical protein AAGB00_01495 [Planctomycetota bacterium]